MLSGQTFVVAVTLDDLGDVVDVVFGGIRVLFKSVQLGVLRHGTDELLEVGRVGVRVCIHTVSSLFFPLKFSLPLRFQYHLFFLFFLLDMTLHVCYFAFNEVQFLVKFFEVLTFFLRPRVVRCGGS